MIPIQNNKSVKFRGAWPLLGDDFDPMRFDEGIRDLVVDLNQAGYETLASCQGGEGHYWSYYDESSHSQKQATPAVSFNGCAGTGFFNRARILGFHIELILPTDVVPFLQTYICPRSPEEDCKRFCERMRKLFGLGDPNQEEIRDLWAMSRLSGASDLGASAWCVPVASDHERVP